jgi:hypothetical protein
MIKRVARDKINKKKINFMEPLDISKFGTDEDPCFGKHHDPKASECGRCGDVEICSIICSQMMHVKRELIEKGQRFKDIEPLETKKVKTLNQLILDKLTSSPGKKLRLTMVAQFIKENRAEYVKTDKILVCKALRKLVKSSSLFKLIKRKEKTYITLK